MIDIIDGSRCSEDLKDGSRNKSQKGKEMPTDSFERLTFRNIGYNSIARIMSYIFSMASNIVLGRCLHASDYGIVSFAFIFVLFMEKFADIGIGGAIVQRKILDETALYTAFTLKFILGCAVAAATFVLTFIIPYFFDNPNVVVVLRLMSLCFLFNNISFLPNSLLTREMNFKKISLVETIVSFLNSLIAIVLALNGYGYWSIVAAYLLSNFLSAAMLALIRPVKVGFRIDYKIVKELVNFGGYLFLFGLCGFLIANLDNFIVGSVKGAQELGYYSLAFNWSSMICLLMYSVVLRVIFPLMARMQDQMQEIRRSYLKILEYSAYIIVLANIGLLVISKEFLISVLGHGSDKWLPALAALRILCIYGIIRGLLEPISQVIVALGKTQTLFKANLIASVIEAAAVYPALKYYGIKGVACVVTFAYLSQYVVFYCFLKINLQIKLGDLAKAIKPSFLAAFPVLLLYTIFPGYYSANLLWVLVKASIVVIVYIATLGIVTDWELYDRIRNLLLRDKSLSDTA